VLADVLGLRSPADAAHGGSRRHTFGKGRVAYLPALPPSRPIPRPADYHRVNVQQLPANWCEFVEAVRWAHNGPAIELLGPRALVAEFLRQGRRLLVHLVNYDLHRAASGVEIRLSAALCRGCKRARYVSPDETSPVPLDLLSDPRGKLLTVPSVDVYGIAIVE